ncbi:MAG TPA: hypothetical protein PLA06_07020 [Syntrophorhabdaceae bacterium]|nr:hypothetical protein [Syntrophorhabdaceae bacterium]
MKKQRTKQHYENMLTQNPNTTIGFTLAAQAVYAATFGEFDANSDDHDEEVYRKIALSLKNKYGDSLTVEQVQYEMINTERTGTMIIRKVPQQLRRDFKVCCVREGISQQDKIVEFMREFVAQKKEI